MEGLFAVILIIVGIVNSVMKQQKQQNRTQMPKNRQVQRNRRVQYQTRMEKQIMQPLAKTIRDKAAGLGGETVSDYKESEGIEAEDRSRVGSLDYVEQSRSSEGNELEKRVTMIENAEGKIASKLEIHETEKDSVFEFTEDDLARSIVMAEILGPPRALKRNIR